MVGSYPKTSNIDASRVFKIILTILCLAANSLYAQSIKLDKRLGAANSLIVESQTGIYPNQALDRLVKRVGAKLVANLDDRRFEFSFKVVDDPMPNAFALPGGYVYVTRGILTLITSEDELACVMAHEIIHVTERHSIRQLRRSILPRLLEVPGNIVGNVVSDDLGALLNTPIQTSNNLLLANYSRGHEKESDMLGITLASKAGYDPTAMSRILTRLSEAVEILTQEKEKRGYFDDHPYTPDRVSAIQKRSKSLPPPITSRKNAGPPAALDNMTFGPNPDKGFFRENVFLHPALNFTISFPKDWETRNQPTSAGAIQKSHLGAIFIGLANQDADLYEQAKAFIEKNEIDKGPDSIKPTPYSLNGNDGYLVSLTDRSGDQPMSLHILWTKLGGNKYQLIGFAPLGFEEDLRIAANTFRQLTETERASIKRRVVTITKPIRGESFEDIHTRLNSIASMKITRLINGMDTDEEIAPGQRIKIIREVSYH